MTVLFFIFLRILSILTHIRGESFGKTDNVVYLKGPDSFDYSFVCNIIQLIS